MKKYLVFFIVYILSSCWAYAGDIQVEQLAKTTKSWNGVSLPDFSENETEVTVLKITIAPHTKLPIHYHPVINIAYMLAGELTVISENGAEKVISKGDSLVELVNQNHYGVNRGDEPVEIVVVYVGEEQQPITIKD